MRKLVLIVAGLFCSCVLSANAQVKSLEARISEWNGYSLPPVNFSRQITPDKELIFRVPADWKQEGKELTFSGPHSAKIQVIVQKVPDGYPLQDYFGSILRSVKDSPEAIDAILTRTTQLQNLEAREILLETPNTEGELIRSTTWLIVSGPLAVTLNLQVLDAHAVEVEPFFKAVVQSAILVENANPGFEGLRTAHIRSPVPGPIHEIESIVASLDDTNSNRELAVTRLSSLFSSQPDAAVDLLLDRRPLVRWAAVKALGQSNNKALIPFLWEMVTDREPLVAEVAARGVAETSDVIAETLMRLLPGFETQTIARVWPFLSKDKRNELLQKIFSVTAIRRESPPAVAKAPGQPSVSVKLIEIVPVKPGKTPPIADVTGVSLSQDPNVQMGALTLLGDIPPEEFKLPLARIIDSNYDPLITVALQVANNRGESLPLESLLKLIASADQQVSKLAAQSLGLSANVSDIPRLEALLSKDAASQGKSLDNELKLSIKKIRFREQLSKVRNASESREIINKALSDPSLADFAWRYDCEATVSGCAPIFLKHDFAIRPFAENLFPKRVVNYTAIPDPGKAVQKFYESLHGLQLDSPRAQSNLVLMMGGVRQMLTNVLSAPPAAARLIDYTGIDPDSPIVLSAWTAEGALDSTASARRRAIVLRVKDRERFERLVEKFQQTSGSFTNLTDYIAGGTRLIAALPAILPFSAQAILSVDFSKPASQYLLKYAFVGEKQWNGFAIKTIEHRRINAEWQIEGSTTHMVFLGDTVVLAPDLATIRDLLANVSNHGERQNLADNPEFRKTIESNGDIVYFSNLAALMGEATGKGSSYNVNENGALNITSSSWENSHHLVFAESDWSKPLLPFDPKELSAPRELLPASTVVYFMMKVDAASAWSNYANTFFSPGEIETISHRWSVDFKKDVLPELGPECGAVVLGLPNMNDLSGATAAVFCKLKSNKLADALRDGKLLLGTGPTNSFARINAGEYQLFITTRSGFLVVSNSEKGLAAFESKSSLAATRDYSRAVQKVPGDVIAFGGYNLEAAVAAASNMAIDGLRGQVANVLFSIASAFHSQNFYATATAGTVEARSSVSMDRQGRYAVADFYFLPKGANITYATLEPGGVPITDQKRLSSLVMRIRAKTAGPIDNIKDDIKSADQTVQQESANELIVTVAARRPTDESRIELPVKDEDLALYLKATAEFPADDKRVKDRAREIVGNDKDALGVARKLADWIHKNLEWKMVATATAAQTLATREADCSEFSDLFVAMARSLGLPARTVSGLAYSGNSFGGHAWVEVWAGKWIELDPTWGTQFVDATHVRGASTALLTSAALNLIDIEVLETRRTVTDFQKSPKALAEHLVKVLPLGDKSEIEATIDVETLTDELMGAGAWSNMNAGEREQIWPAYRRVLNELVEGYKISDSSTNKVRLLHLEEKDNTAEAICLVDPLDVLLKLRFKRRNNAWYLVEMLQADTGLQTIAETFQPAISSIKRTRLGENRPTVGRTDFLRLLFLIENNSEKAVAVADEVLKAKPNDKNLRYLKALALFKLNKADEARNVLRQLADEAFAPAIYKLANNLHFAEAEKDKKEAIEFYERYLLLEPHDPRAWRYLAMIYEDAHNLEKAEVGYRKAVECDPGDSYNHISLLDFLIRNDRLGEVKAMLVAAENRFGRSEDIFGSVMNDLYGEGEYKQVEKFAASEPSRMKTSAQASLALGQTFSITKHYAEAVRLLNTAAQLDKESSIPYSELAYVYRKMFKWLAAFKSAEQAIKLDDLDAEAHYERACALARLGKLKEAMSALNKAIELDPDQADRLAGEKDLNALRSFAAFKKLLQKPTYSKHHNQHQPLPRPIQRVSARR